MRSVNPVSEAARLAQANRVVIGAVLSSVGTLRYSPAGVPILDATAEHCSEQSEAGSGRRVECVVPLLAAGDTARQLAQHAPGTAVELHGFLAARHRNSAVLVLHVREFQTIQTD